MEMVFNEGQLKPIMTWGNFIHQFKKTKQMVEIPVKLWYRAKDNAWITLAGRKSIASSAHVSIKIYPDASFVGRFIVSAHAKSKAVDIAHPIAVAYGNRKYVYEITKKKRSWEIDFDGKKTSIQARTPLMSTNMLPRLNEKRPYKNEIKIVYRDAPNS